MSVRIRPKLAQDLQSQKFHCRRLAQHPKSESSQNDKGREKDSNDRCNQENYCRPKQDHDQDPYAPTQEWIRFEFFDAGCGLLRQN